MIGVPYAMVVFKDDVSDECAQQCPECLEEFPMRYDPEADMGCGAMVSDYAIHYEVEHVG